MDEERENKKRAIFNSMSERRRAHIIKMGYEKWDPFQEPKDPIDMRRDKTRRTSQVLIREFLQGRDADTYSNAYGQGAFDMCMGIINDDERYKGMYEFACWYQALLKKEGYGESA